MDEVSFLPTFPLVAGNLMLIGAALLCGLAAGHVFARYGQNDSGWLRDTFRQTKSLSDVVRLQSGLWSAESPAQSTP